MKKILTLMIFTLLIISTSCTTTFVVKYPTGGDGIVSSEYKIVGNRIQITVQFSDPVDKSTVIVGKTFLLDTGKDPDAQGNIVWPTPDKLIFTTTKPFVDLLLYQTNDAYFSLKLIGTDTGVGAIKDLKGRCLDGDRSGTDGGDYKTMFVHVG